MSRSRGNRKLRRKEFDVRYRLGEFRERWVATLASSKNRNVALHLVYGRQDDLPWVRETVNTVCGQVLITEPSSYDTGAGLCHACVGSAMGILSYEAS